VVRSTEKWRLPAAGGKPPPGRRIKRHRFTFPLPSDEENFGRWVYRGGRDSRGEKDDAVPRSSSRKTAHAIPGRILLPQGSSKN